LDYFFLRRWVAFRIDSENIWITQTLLKYEIDVFTRWKYPLYREREREGENNKETMISR